MEFVGKFGHVFVGVVFDGTLNPVVGFELLLYQFVKADGDQFYNSLKLPRKTFAALRVFERQNIIGIFIGVALLIILSMRLLRIIKKKSLLEIGYEYK